MHPIMSVVRSPPPGLQPEPALPLPERGQAAAGPGSGVVAHGDGAAGHPGAAGGCHPGTSCPPPVLPAAHQSDPTRALLGPAG